MILWSYQVIPCSSFKSLYLDYQMIHVWSYKVIPSLFFIQFTYLGYVVLQSDSLFLFGPLNDSVVPSSDSLLSNWFVLSAVLSDSALLRWFFLLIVEYLMKSPITVCITVFEGKHVMYDTIHVCFTKLMVNVKWWLQTSCKVQTAHYCNRFYMYEYMHCMCYFHFQLCTPVDLNSAPVSLNNTLVSHG